MSINVPIRNASVPGQQHETSDALTYRHTTQRWVSGKIEKKKILENVSSGGWIGSFVRLKTILEKRCEQKLSINSLLSTILVRLRPLINK